MSVFAAERAERYREVPGYGGRYKVSDLGRVFTRGYEMSLVDGRYVKLCWKGVVKRVDVAYLVAEAFVMNEMGWEYVERKDGDVRNCKAENLRWVQEEPRVKRGRKSGHREVVQYDLDGEMVARYGSVAEAVAGSGVSEASIRACLAGRNRRAGKFVFKG